MSRLSVHGNWILIVVSAYLMRSVIIHSFLSVSYLGRISFVVDRFHIPSKKAGDMISPAKLFFYLWPLLHRGRDLFNTESNGIHCPNSMVPNKDLTAFELP